MGVSDNPAGTPTPVWVRYERLVFASFGPIPSHCWRPGVVEGTTEGRVTVRFADGTRLDVPSDRGAGDRLRWTPPG